ncbi:hypothetical protein [Pseudomonas sp. 58 R 3]|nr:hypothetical protein [Pseudomonas sp. 58 R 3]
MHLTDHGGQRPVTGNQPTLGVLQAIGRDSQAAVAENTAFVLVVDCGGGNLGVLFGTQCAALVVQRLGIHVQRAAGNHTGAGVGDGLAAQAHVARGVASVVGVDAGFNDVAVGQRAAAGQRNAVTGSQTLAVGKVALGVHVKGGTGIHRPFGVQACGVDVDRAAGGSLRQAQMPIGIELDITTTGRQRAVELHTHTGFGAHQFDCTGVHAAQGAGVDGQLGFGAAVVGPHSGFEAFGVDVVAPGDHGQLTGVDLCVDLGRAGDDFEAVDVAGVQAFAVDGHGAAVHLVVVQATDVVHHRLAGGQGHVGRVDKPATAARDAVRVGDDHLGRLPRHFGVTTQLARAAAVDFVEDDVRRAALEVGVADDVTAQLGVGHRARGVVEDHAVGADVVVLELVVGQATAIRGGDVHHRHAIARLADAGGRVAHHNAFGLGQQRLPEQRVDQDQHQPALGQAEERVAALQGSRRLAGQKGKVANIHGQILVAAGR